MPRLVQHSGIAVPLIQNNVDTDQIIPSREMKRVSKVGLSDGLFSGQRYLYNGLKKIGLNPEFILNESPYERGTILLSGRNFGCGSSREHAVWALKEYGFRIIIAESYGEIFRNNCIRNGIVPVELDIESIEILVNQTSVGPKSKPNLTTVDLENFQVIAPNGETFSFSLEEYAQQMLINGWDFIDLALRHRDKIDDFIAQDSEQRSWAYL